MLYTLFNVVYVLVAVAMTALILLQQGDGASAGSGFGAGASGTVFGARGSANFMSKSTAVLATLFFAMSLGMAVYMHKAAGPSAAADDTGIMGSAVPAETVERQVPASSEVPQPTPAPAMTPEAANADTPAITPVETPVPVETPAPEPASD